MSPSPNGKLRKVGATSSEVLLPISLSRGPGSWFPALHVQKNNNRELRAAWASAEISFVWLPRKRGRTMGHTSKIKCELILVSVALWLYGITWYPGVSSFRSARRISSSLNLCNRSARRGNKWWSRCFHFNWLCPDPEEGLHTNCHSGLLCSVLSRVSRSFGLSIVLY